MEDELNRFFFGQRFEFMEKSFLAVYPVKTDEVRRGRETGSRKTAMIGPGQLVQDVPDG